MPALFEAYVTNLGKYNEGELVGEYLKFPTTPEEVQALLKRIGIDGVRYEEIFITDFDGDVLGLYDHLGEYENIDELIEPARGSARAAPKARWSLPSGTIPPSRKSSPCRNTVAM